MAKNPQFRPRGPKWFHPAELHELAILRALVPDSMPTVAALVALRPGGQPWHLWARPWELFAFRLNLEEEFFNHAWTCLVFAQAPRILIGPVLKLASCAHPQALAEDLLARQTRIRGLLSTVATGDSGETYGRHVWSCVWGGDSSKEASRPPAMTPREAVAALAPKVGLSYLLARPESHVRQWAFEQLPLIR